jgi:hypothetical protein
VSNCSPRSTRCTRTSYECRAGWAEVVAARGRYAETPNEKKPSWIKRPRRFLPPAGDGDQHRLAVDHVRQRGPRLQRIEVHLSGRLKYVVLTMLLSMNLGIAVLLGLPVFSGAMIVADAVFLPDRFDRFLGRMWRRTFSRAAPRRKGTTARTDTPLVPDVVQSGPASPSPAPHLVQARSPVYDADLSSDDNVLGRCGVTDLQPEDPRSWRRTPHHRRRAAGSAGPCPPRWARSSSRPGRFPAPSREPGRGRLGVRNGRGGVHRDPRRLAGAGRECGRDRRRAPPRADLQPGRRACRSRASSAPWSARQRRSMRRRGWPCAATAATSSRWTRPSRRCAKPVPTLRPNTRRPHAGGLAVNVIECRAGSTLTV